MKLKVGITGGIGSGKTLVCELFRTLGIPIYNSDLRAKYLMKNNPEVKKQLIGAFGNIYTSAGELDKEKIARIIFSDKTKLQIMNSIVHPAVEKDFEQWAEKQKSPYVIKESALIFESGNHKKLDFTIEVFAPLEERISRTIARDKKTAAQIRKRINSQMDEKKKIAMADFIIINDKFTPILPQVLNLHKFFLIHSLL